MPIFEIGYPILKTMLVVILLFFIAECIRKFIDIPFKRRIRTVETVEDSLRIRRRLIIVRRVVTFALIILLVVISAYLGLKYGYGHDLDLLKLVGAYAIVSGFRELKGNVQNSTLSDYLAKHPVFSVYLRAFDADYYSSSPGSKAFEDVFTTRLKKKGVNVCAVGMTREVDAPYGAARVYLSDETWQQGVKELLNRAEFIFILVSDRESCIWEIRQCLPILNKVCFVVNDIERYDHVRGQLEDIVPLPNLYVSQEEQTKKKKKKTMKNPSLAIVFDDNGTPTVLPVDESLDTFTRSLFSMGKIKAKGKK